MNQTIDFATGVIFQGIFIGVVIAVLTVGYNKLIIGRFVKALIAAKANHPAFAKTFGELNIRGSIFIKFALRGVMLKKIVAELEGEEIRYYIPEDKLYRAGRMYGGKDVDVLMLASVLLVLFLFFGILLLYFPALWTGLSNIFRDTFGG